MSCLDSMCSELLCLPGLLTAERPHSYKRLVRDRDGVLFGVKEVAIVRDWLAEGVGRILCIETMMISFLLFLT